MNDTIYVMSAPVGTLHPGDIPTPEVDLIKVGRIYKPDKTVAQRRDEIAALYDTTDLEIVWSISAPRSLETFLKRLLRPARFPMRRALNLLAKYRETLQRALRSRRPRR